MSSALLMRAVLLSVIDLASSAQVTWTLSNQTMPTARADMAFGFNSSLIWLLGGLQGDNEWSRDVFTFAPATQAWDFLRGDYSPQLFECYAQCSAQFATWSSQTDFPIFILGPIQQKSHGDNGWIYFAQNASFNTMDFEYFPDQAEWPCVVADNQHFNHSEIVYIVGGIGEENSNTWPIADILGYNLSAKSWMLNLTKMNSPRYAGSCILVNDYIYYFGGDNGTDVVTSIERYDIVGDEWVSLNTTLSVKRTGHRNVYVPKHNAVLIIGGVTDTLESVSSVEYFDVSSQQMVAAYESNMNLKRGGVAAIAWANDTVYVFGGTENGTFVHSTYEVGYFVS